MFRLYLWCLVCSVSVALSAVAQPKRFSHAIGVGLYNSPAHFAGGLVYAPRFHAIRFSARAALSLGTQLGLGASFHNNYNSGGGTPTSIFMMDMPLLVTYNYGHAAMMNSSAGWGFFTGAGYAFHHANRNTNAEEEEETDTRILISGAVLTAGCRFAIAGTSLGLHISWLFNNNHYNTDIPGIASAGLSCNIIPRRK
ncbi:hypothetical protein ECE50_016420 [Chitinophaga sp. Mgbs1]|uniref:Outer membrane protein beta-barrel domain-containing protein n=1 Tax=Chitinophaga solisilvae TaxID=1233460 RepID=A0A9Q5D2B7_9BACT|nr:hypothetical protein [Chitinophaga solisilvae]